MFVLIVPGVFQGKDEVYDRMLLDYFLSYHQFIHLLCRVAINCEKFTDTLVKLSMYRVCVCAPVCVPVCVFPTDEHRCFLSQVC